MTVSDPAHVPNYLLCNNDTMRKATRAVGQLYDDVLAPSGLRNTQFGLLVHIDELDEPTVKALAEELVMDQSALGQTLKPLVRDGLVRLVPNPEDGRSKRVTLTKAGQRKVAETMSLWADAQGRLEQVFGDEKARHLREALLILASPEFATAFAGSTMPHKGDTQ
jgi:DNA-binding MarR family transcriptional regulator